MEITEVYDNKKRYLDLLLLADEQEGMIDRYIDQGRMFILSDKEVRCAAVVIELNKRECELKNIAVYPTHQGKGFGQIMIRHLLKVFLEKYEVMYVGTGDVPKALRFYKKYGFKPSHRVENFFTENYSMPIIEDGIQLIDMVYLKADMKAAPENEN